LNSFSEYGLTFCNISLVLKPKLPKFQIPIEFQNDPTALSPERSTSNRAGNKKEPIPSKFSIRCPFDFTDNKAGDENMPSGVDRITRHPGLWSMAMFSAGHAFTITSLSIPQFSFFLMPACVAFFGGAHTDSRFRRGLGGSLGGTYDEYTSNIPFVGFLKHTIGTVTYSGSPAPHLGQLLDEVKVLNAVIAVGSAFSLALLRRPLVLSTSIATMRRRGVANLTPS